LDTDRMEEKTILEDCRTRGVKEEAEEIDHHEEI
jgi:hypothetical protein